MSNAKPYTTEEFNGSNLGSVFDVTIMDSERLLATFVERDALCAEVARLKTEVSVLESDCADGTCRACVKCCDAALAERDAALALADATQAELNAERERHHATLKAADLVLKDVQRLERSFSCFYCGNDRLTHEASCRVREARRSVEKWMNEALKETTP